ncbi:diguanylate cyclase [Thalassotalea sp. SU-HH00458]|uniref:tetratricopeptide repeat-containing diguanylate cyclase n=1 Tax=Thalassotalea sp. SU-HH00458 TaxID=3127657 RepID=UPI0031095B01
MWLTITGNVLASENNNEFATEVAEIKLLLKEQPEVAKNKSISLLERSKQQDNELLEIEALYLLGSTLRVIGDFENIEIYIERGKALAKQYNIKEKLIEFAILESDTLLQKSNMSQAQRILEDALLFAEQIDNDKLVNEIYIKQGYLLFINKQSELALPLISKAYNYFEKVNDNSNMVFSLNLFAMIYQANQQWEKSIEYYLKAIDYSQSPEKSYEMSVLNLNIGIAYFKAGDLTQAKEYIKKSENISHAIEDKLGVAYALNSLSDIEEELGKLHSAIRIKEKALVIYQEFNSVNSVFYVNLALIRQKIKIDDFDSAEALIEQLKTSKEFAENDLFKLDTLDAENFFFEKQSKYEQAYAVLIKKQEVEKNVEQKENVSSLNEMQVKFDSLLKEQENKLLKQENESAKAQLAIQEQRLVNQILIGVILVLIISIILFLYARSHKTRIMLTKMALTDSLTNVANHRATILNLDEEFSRARRYNSPLLIALVDLDFFKKINDLYGHDIGDKVLIEFASVAQTSIRDVDYIGRIGGEEFLFIFPQTDIAYLESIIHRLRENLKQINLPDEDHKVTVSIGITEIKTTDENYSEMLKRADNALYQAKSQGRDRSVQLLNTQRVFAP